MGKFRTSLYMCGPFCEVSSSKVLYCTSTYKGGYSVEVNVQCRAILYRPMQMGAINGVYSILVNPDESYYVQANVNVGYSV